MSDVNLALLTCNLLALVLAALLIWSSRGRWSTPDGRARLLSSVSVGAFGVAGLAKRINHPWAAQITLGAWVVVLTAQWWKWRDQVHENQCESSVS